MPNPADEYLAAALAIIEQHAMHRARIDWTALRLAAARHAAGAFTPADTYDTIRWLLTQAEFMGKRLRRIGMSMGTFTLFKPTLRHGFMQQLKHGHLNRSYHQPANNDKRISRIRQVCEVCPV